MKIFFKIIFFVFLSIRCFSQDDIISAQEALFSQESSKDFLLSARYTNDETLKFKYYLEALKTLRNNNQLDKVSNLLSEINNTWNTKRDVTNSLRCALEELKIAENSKNSDRRFFLYKLLGSIYLYEKSYNRTLDFFRKAEEIIDLVSNNRTKAEFAILVGDVHCLAKQYDTSLPYYFEGLKFFETSENNQAKQNDILYKIMDACLAKKDYKALYGVSEKLRNSVRNIDPAVEAVAIANMGVANHYQGNYSAAINEFEEAIKLNDPQKNYLDFVAINSDLGVAYQNNGEPTKAYAALQRAIGTSIKNNKKTETARLEFLLAGIYFQNKDYFNAQQYNNEAIKNSKSSRNADLLSKSYELSAKINQSFFEYEAAFSDYRKHLEINDSLLFFERGRQKDLERQVFLLEKTEKELQLSLINQDIQTLTIKQLQLDKERSRLENDKKDNELLLVKREQEIVAANLKNKELEAQKAQQALDLASQQLLQSEKDKALSILQQKEKLQKAELAAQDAVLAQKIAEDKESQRSIELLTKDKDLLLQDSKIKELELDSQRTFRKNAYWLGILLSIIIGLSAFGYYFAKRNNAILENKNKEIILEREKSDNLLRNILPEKTAMELKNTGEAKPRYYEKVSVLFADFTNFTTAAEKLSPQELIEELNDCFIHFDEIIERHNLEKIKTIGDAYMCAGGLPEPNNTNPHDAVAAAQELMEFMRVRNIQKRAKGEVFWEMRIGINTGSVIAGVVGKQKFAYDIWGDAVNLAARLETASKPGKINISQSTFDNVKDKYTFTERGKLSVKNKGEVMMFFVES